MGVFQEAKNRVKQATEVGTDQAFGHQRFTLVVRGYDRHEVDAYLAEYERWAGEVTTKLERTESKLGEATNRVRSLEAKVSKLEERAGDVPPPSMRTLADRVDEIVGETWEAARELRAHLAAEAHATSERAQERADDLIEAARARATGITEDAQRDREQGARTLEEARRRARRLVDQGEAVSPRR